MEKKRKAPGLRFRGFEEEWEEKELGKLSSLITKGTSPLDTNGDRTVNFVKIENISALSGEINTSTKITLKEHEGYLKRSQLHEDDVLFSIAGTLGRVSVVNKDILPANTNQALAIIRFKKGNIKYVTTFLKGKAISEYLKKNPTVGAQPNLSLEQVGSLDISLPLNEEEQTQIGAFFQHLDALIDLRRRKLDKLTAVKKAMLDKMFPQEGADAPEIRFKGFTGKWERKQLSAITQKIGSGKTPKGGDSTYVSEGIALLRSQNIRDNIIDLSDVAYITPQIDEEMNNSRVSKNDILLNITGASIGRSAVFRLSILANVNQHVCIIRPTSGYCSGFIQLNLTSSDGQKKINDNQAGGGRQGLNFQQIGRIDFMFPNTEEQSKIASFFQHLDSLIALQGRELDKLKQIKKACLEKMFI